LHPVVANCCARETLVKLLQPRSRERAVLSSAMRRALAKLAVTNHLRAGPLVRSIIVGNSAMSVSLMHVSGQRAMGFTPLSHPVAADRAQGVVADVNPLHVVSELWHMIDSCTQSTRANFSDSAFGFSGWSGQADGTRGFLSDCLRKWVAPETVWGGWRIEPFASAASARNKLFVGITRIEAACNTAKVVFQCLVFPDRSTQLSVVGDRAATTISVLHQRCAP
jgi:hypothetical protein